VNKNGLPAESEDPNPNPNRFQLKTKEFVISIIYLCLLIEKSFISFPRRKGKKYNNLFGILSLDNDVAMISRKQS